MSETNSTSENIPSSESKPGTPSLNGSDQSSLRKPGCLAWLFHNVDYKFWTVWIGTIVTAFSLGISVGRSDWFGRLTGNAKTSTSESKSQNELTPNAKSSSLTVATGDFIREGSAGELTDYFDTIAPLQKKPLFESSYLGRRVRWRGRVMSVSELGKEYRVYVVEDTARGKSFYGIALSFSPDWRSRIEQLREGDDVSFEGSLESFYGGSFTVNVDKLSLNPRPSPSPTSSVHSKQ